MSNTKQIPRTKKSYLPRAEVKDIRQKLDTLPPGTYYRSDEMEWLLTDSNTEVGYYLGVNLATGKLSRFYPDTFVWVLSRPVLSGEEV